MSWKRLIAIIACVLSLVLFLLVVAAWSLSRHWQPQSLGPFGLPGQVAVWIDPGVVNWRYMYAVDPPVSIAEWDNRPRNVKSFAPRRHKALNFAFVSGHEIGLVDSLSGTVAPSRYSLLRTPLWFFLLLFGAYPVLWFCWLRRRMLKRDRASRGLCIEYGYDLRGTAARDCPECGCSHREQQRLEAA